MTTAPAFANSGDPARELLELPWFERMVRALLRESRGGALLDLGCADGWAERAAGGALRRYVGVDLTPPPGGVAHDLRGGLGPVGAEPFDLYVGAFGIASHLSPAQLARLLGQIAVHARPGSLVALEALGLYSLEWPRLWSLPPGPGRTIPYRLAADVPVHPWAPRELFALFEAAGLRPLRAIDRSIQAPPKVGEGRYWPGLPDVRAGLNRLLAGGGVETACGALAAPLGPLPNAPAALLHHELTRRRAELVSRGGHARTLARAVWSLEPRTCGGYGHGLLVIARA